jgi:hypothetical protein
VLRAICRRPYLQFAANDADHRHRRRAGGSARCKDSNFMESSRLRYLKDWSPAERSWFIVRGIGVCGGALRRCYGVTSRDRNAAWIAPAW